MQKKIYKIVKMVFTNQIKCVKIEQKEREMTFTNYTSDELKLIDNKFQRNSADEIARTRMNNWRSMNAISGYYFDGKVKKILNGYGLPTNPAYPNETNEFYSAMAFFKNNKNYFEKSPAMAKIIDLFSWEHEDYENYVRPYLVSTELTKSLMISFKDIDIRKIANLFAEKGNKPLEEKSITHNSAELAEAEKLVVNKINEWKNDIIEYYRSNNDEK